MLTKSKQGGRYKQIKRANNKLKINEKELQSQCENYLQYLDITFIRIPDSVYRAIFSHQTAVKPYIRALISKAIKGVPDLTLLHKGRFLCVELKVGKNKMTLGQKQWARNILTWYEVVDNFEDFKKIVDDFI
jgi:hypothetical protein